MSPSPIRLPLLPSYASLMKGEGLLLQMWVEVCHQVRSYFQGVELQNGDK